jgi:two-component system sensor kinase FixL
MRSILATVPDAVVVISERGTIISFSSAAERMFGFTENEVLGQNIRILMTSPDREQHDSHIARYAATSQSRVIGLSRVTAAQRRDGSIFPIEIRVGEAITPKGRVFTGFIRDLTETHRAERQLQDLRSELANVSKINAVGTLAATLAHELNQPLTAIANYVESARDMLKGEMPEDEVLREALAEAATQSLRAGRVIRRLRDFIARGGSTRSIHSLQKLITEANALALVGDGLTEIQVRINLDPTADSVFTDRIQIHPLTRDLGRSGRDYDRGQRQGSRTGSSRNAVRTVSQHQGKRARPGPLDLPNDHREPGRPHLVRSLQTWRHRLPLHTDPCRRTASLTVQSSRVSMASPSPAMKAMRSASDRLCTPSFVIRLAR